MDWMKVKTFSRCHIFCLFLNRRISGLEENLKFFHLSFLSAYLLVGGLVDWLKVKSFFSSCLTICLLIN